MTTIHEALLAVSEQIRVVGKGDFNSQQKYRFRGVDAVVNAVSPAFRKHGVTVTPEALDYDLTTFATAKGSPMERCVVRVAYTFTGPEGDSVRTVAFGEGSDSLDKATSKAMSVAFRTALLQTLVLPTDEPDPDSFSPPAMSNGEPTTKTKLTAAKAKVWQAAQANGWDKDALSEAYFNQMGAPIGEATYQDLEAYLKTLVAEKEGE